MPNKNGVLIRRRAGDKSKRLVIVNGWFSEGKSDPLNNWQNTIDRFYSDWIVYNLDWKATTTGGLVMRCLGTIGGLSIPGKIAGVAAQVLAQWMMAVGAAEEAGIHLAVSVESAAERARGKPPKWVFMGHSLGARVIYHALQALALHSDTRIHHVQLLGGAVNTDANWDLAVQAVTTRVCNYYSCSDPILTFLYFVGTMGGDPIGVNPIPVSSNRKVKNIDVSLWLDRESLLNTGQTRHAAFVTESHRFLVRPGR